MTSIRISLIAAACALGLAGGARAGVSAQEAEQLKTTLTPLGAERGANKEGTIPAWTGGCPKTSVAGDKNPPDPHAGDQPLFTITKANMAQHAGKLNDAAKHMLQNYEGYKIVVFPTRRSFCAPQYVYDGAMKNATRAKTAHNGMAAANWSQGVPFPIPKSGLEALWNAQYAFRGTDRQVSADTWYISADGTRSLSTANVSHETYPPYYPAGRDDPWKGAFALWNRADTVGPPSQAGGVLLIGVGADQVETKAKSWRYLTGQRRLRLFPQANYDTPSPLNSGMTNFDDAFGFTGLPDRYDVKLVGKQELYVPYNNNGFFQEPDTARLLGSRYVNPDKLRYELHRVWVIDLTLKEGARHTVPKRRLYLDEDSWWLAVTDQWDAKGQLWKTIIGTSSYFPQVPVVGQVMTIAHDVQTGAYSVFNLYNKGKVAFGQYPASYYTPEAVTAGGVR